MTWSTRIGVAVVAGAALFMAPRLKEPASDHQSPADNSSKSAHLEPDAQPQQVQVEYLLVTAELAADAPAVTPAVERRAVAPRARADQRRARFAEKARRLLLGDGRVRPEPFPRVR